MILKYWKTAKEANEKNREIIKSFAGRNEAPLPPIISNIYQVSLLLLFGFPNINWKLLIKSELRRKR
jgi:hypothetical protein